MIVADHRLLNAATAHSAAVLALVDDLRAARGVQWEAPPGAVLRIEHDFHSDYTGETAANAARLKLRAAIESGFIALEDATRAMQDAHIALDTALRPYVAREREYPAAHLSPETRRRSLAAN